MTFSLRIVKVLMRLPRFLTVTFLVSIALLAEEDVENQILSAHKLQSQLQKTQFNNLGTYELLLKKELFMPASYSVDREGASQVDQWSRVYFHKGHLYYKLNALPAEARDSGDFVSFRDNRNSVEQATSTVLKPGTYGEVEIIRKNGFIDRVKATLNHYEIEPQKKDMSVLEVNKHLGNYVDLLYSVPKSSLGAERIRIRLNSEREQSPILDDEFLQHEISELKQVSRENIHPSFMFADRISSNSISNYSLQLQETILFPGHHEDLKKRRSVFFSEGEAYSRIEDMPREALAKGDYVEIATTSTKQTEALKQGMQIHIKSTERGLKRLQLETTGTSYSFHVPDNNADMSPLDLQKHLGQEAELRAKFTNDRGGEEYVSMRDGSVLNSNQLSQSTRGLVETLPKELRHFKALAGLCSQT